MRKTITLAVCVLSALGIAASAAAHEEAPHGGAANAPKPPPGLKFENLMKTVLEGVDGIEVIVSRVTVPPHTTLPKHWHPGEEFAYMVEGSVTLWQEGKDDTPIHVGEVGMVPLKQVHTAITGEEGATIVVFRVHAQGEPERVLVD